MKNLLLILMLSFFLNSCYKERVPAYYNLYPHCTCGSIVNSGFSNGCYWFDLYNYCSGNTRRFCFERNIWATKVVGEELCLSNQPPW
jgi:hypothetical protein